MVEIGQALSVEVIEADERTRYKCKIADVENGAIHIDYPVNEKTGKVGFFLDGTEFKVFIINEKEDTLYYFLSTVVGRKKENIPLLLIEQPHPSQYIKVQRRQFVRIDTAVDVAVHSEGGKFAPFTTITKDISGGGAALYVEEAFHAASGLRLKMWFALPMQNGEIKYIQTKGKVLRKIHNDQTRPFLTIEFVDLAEFDREAVIRFCFDRQLLYRRKVLD